MYLLLLVSSLILFYINSTVFLLMWPVNFELNLLVIFLYYFSLLVSCLLLFPKMYPVTFCLQLYLLCVIGSNLDSRTLTKRRVDWYRFRLLSSYSIYAFFKLNLFFFDSMVYFCWYCIFLFVISFLLHYIYMLNPWYVIDRMICCNLSIKVLPKRKVVR